MISVGDAIREFLNSCEADGLSPLSARWYAHHLAQALRPSQSLHALSNKEIRAHLVSARDGIAAHTLQGRFRAIRRFVHWCQAEYADLPPGWNPLANVKQPKASKKIPTGVSIDDVIRLLAVTGDGVNGYRDRAIILSLLDTGARAGGIIHARRADLDIMARLLTVREKGDRERRVPFTTYTAGAIEQWLAVAPRSEWLFCSLATNDQGAPLTIWGLISMIKRLKRRAGVKGRVNPHSFRHHYARAMIQNGADLATVSRLMGHSSMEVTAAFYAIFTETELSARHDRFSPVRNLEAALMNDRREPVDF